MKDLTFASKLKKNDCIKVIAPAYSLAIISDEAINIATQNFNKLGLEVVFSNNSGKINDFISSSIKDRLEDIHESFANKEVDAVFTAIGGYNSNQLLDKIDWDLISRNPKIFCGYSDITVLLNAIYYKTGLVTYHGPHYSTLGQKKELEYTIEYLKKCLITESAFEVAASDYWTDDEWWTNQDKRDPQKNEGWFVVNQGIVEGVALGGNISSFSLLKGTEYMPDLTDSILFLEEEGEYTISNFDRELYSLLQQKGGKSLKGLVIGRFQKSSGITIKKLSQIINEIEELKNVPVIVNVDFGHTNPMFTFPVGGRVKINANEKPTLEILEH